MRSRPRDKSIRNRRGNAADRDWLGPESSCRARSCRAGWNRVWNRLSGAICFPTVAKTIQPPMTLIPTDRGGVAEFAQAAVLKTELQIIAKIIGPAEGDSFQPVEICFRSRPACRERFGVTECPTVSLLGCVVMRMDGDRFGAV